MAICVDCGTGSTNTGIPAGAKTPKVPVKFIIQPLVADDGTTNEIDISSSSFVFDQAALDAIVLNADPSKRGYLIDNLKNVISEKADNVVETFDDTTFEVITEGVRNYTSLLPSKPRPYLKNLENFQCENIGVYLIDECGTMVGNVETAGTMRPIKIAQNTWSAILMIATATTGQNIDLTFNVDKGEFDKNHGFLSSSITADMKNIATIKDGLLANDTSTIVGAGTSFIEFDAETLYGDRAQPILVEGLLIGDFTVTLNGGAEVIISSTETPDGHYKLILTTILAPADVITVATVKTGYEFTTLTHTVL